MMYREEELVALAKRENNQKRGYLVVNRLQGKHIPVRPKAALAMFEALAEELLGVYQEERLLLIGFAETATAIGAAAAVRLGTPYMQTTREEIEGVSYFYFSEMHSHATEQKLVRTDLERVIDQIDRIVFIEDEITTGNTILHIVKLLREAYGERIRFSAASILNGMEEEHQKRYEEQGIRLHWLCKTQHKGYEKAVAHIAGDGEYCACEKNVQKEEVIKGKEYRPAGYLDARRLVDGKAYGEACQRMSEEVLGQFSWEQEKSVLVLGTEECMYPGLCVAKRLEEMGHQVRYHATTRSPIVVSQEENYPLHRRYELWSLYEDDRKTFLYEIGTYDEIWIVTDAKKGEKGLKTLVHALQLCENDNIQVVRWC